MIRLLIAQGCGPTGQLLQEMLQAKGLLDGPQKAVVSWGVPYNGALPCLNAAAGGITKYKELEILRAAGVRVPRTWLARDWRQVANMRPILARRFNHKGGRDIRKVHTLRGLQVWSNRRDFWSEFIPSTTEFRVFIYRSAHLATYEKLLRYPHLKHRAVGRNYKNGYAFQLVQEEAIPREAVEQARLAVKARGLDFGAVDVLKGNDGRFYTLEVNTAPGVEGPGRQAMTSLVAKIENWAKKGFKERKADAV